MGGFPMTIEELIARLEAATGPDIELDHEIYHALGLHPKSGPFPRIPNYTASIDTALTLLDPASEYEITTLYGIARVGVDLNHENGPHYGERKDGSVPIALCIAALRSQAGG